MLSSTLHRIGCLKLAVSAQLTQRCLSPSSCLAPTLIARFFGQPAAQTHPHLIAEGEVTPGISMKEFHNRRCNMVRAALKACDGVKSIEHHLFIFPSATMSFMSSDIPYVFRQSTDFLYLCGFQEPDSLLLIKAHRDALATGDHEAVLFVPRRDPAKELWDGPRSGAEGAIALTGIESAFNSNEVEKYLQFYNSKHKNYVLWYSHDQPPHRDFHNRVVSELMKEQRHKCVESPTRLVQGLRLFKSSAEISLMRQSTEIASAAFAEVMKFSKPMINEAQLWAKVDFECRMRGAEFLAYPPVVAGGPRANIIHYITNNQVVLDGEMVLMDAGCEFHGYTSDLTRTWPVSGRFSPPQRQLYNAVLRVQEQCIKLCTPRYSLDEMLTQMLYLLAEELLTVGLIPPGTPRPQQISLARKFCPHHVSHYLGMDVHDTSSVSRTSKLQAGMVVTVEPGIYVPADDFSVAPEFRGIGIRIEDNIVVTESQPINLSESCPKHVDEIEELMSKR